MLVLTAIAQPLALIELPLQPGNLRQVVIVMLGGKPGMVDQAHRLIEARMVDGAGDERSVNGFKTPYQRRAKFSEIGQ